LPIFDIFYPNFLIFRPPWLDFELNPGIPENDQKSSKITIFGHLSTKYQVFVNFWDIYATSVAFFAN